MTEPGVIDDFWLRARAAVSGLPVEVPEAWPFGATPEHADDLLGLVLAGFKTGTASAVWDYEHVDEAFPEPGEFSIILDGAGLPRAVIETTAVSTVAFDRVDAEHARAEGEGDRTLEYWRAAHEQYWREHSENPRGFEPQMPILCERFRLVYSG
ncbi:ASCH domain-containing protein [Mycetocola tolaasinivorans]|uniref:ASCH domain-containing protein n=1 Tax=Mycetocola tolaasinivorans TaxID=76635 RepID=A0A3L7A033_9MICO|nr:ASCH domain-containing protein [Mycetocola tolaasinivorans]RLP73315.1 ASCH domain-containing protein [Mycetocola tolaasinivorans]